MSKAAAPRTFEALVQLVFPGEGPASIDVGDARVTCVGFPGSPATDPNAEADQELDDEQLPVRSAPLPEAVVLFPDESHGYSAEDLLADLGNALNTLATAYAGIAGHAEGWVRRAGPGVIIDLTILPEDDAIQGEAIVMLTPVVEGMALVFLGYRVDFSAIASGTAAGDRDPREAQILGASAPTTGEMRSFFIGPS